MGLGGKVGSGKQGMSWLHEQDMNRIFLWSITNTDMVGIYNATSPSPVSQVEFMRSMRKAMRVPIGLPATELMVRIGARIIMRTDPELALYGRYIYPQRLLDDGFTFDFATLESAFSDLFRKS